MRPQYKFDYDKLLNLLLPLMEKLVAKYPVVAPVGSAMDHEGKCSLLGAYLGDGLTEVGELEELLLDGLRVQAAEGTLRACAVGYTCDVVPHGSDQRIPVLAIKFEHVDGPPETFYQPYKRTWGGTNFDVSFLAAGKPNVFPKTE